MEGLPHIGHLLQSTGKNRAHECRSVQPLRVDNGFSQSEIGRAVEKARTDVPQCVAGHERRVRVSTAFKDALPANRLCIRLVLWAMSRRAGSVRRSRPPLYRHTPISDFPPTCLL